MLNKFEIRSFNCFGATSIYRLSLWLTIVCCAVCTYRQTHNLMKTLSPPFASFIWRRLLYFTR